MEVNVKQAIKLFFSKSSFEMIFLEAFANALDAGATKFEIDIELPDFSQLQNLRIRLIDNGIGFNDSRFDKFSKLLEVEETSHKGLGRLVYLCYFDSVNIESFYDNGKKLTIEKNWNNLLAFQLDDADEHNIELVYRPTGFGIGSKITIFSIVLLILFEILNLNTIKNRLRKKRA